MTCLFFAVSADAANKKFTLVVDAGHGGGDTGAIGKGKTREKDLTLKFALAFGKLVEKNCPDVNVIYTRKTDKFVELYRRAEIANNNKADLFISIHINALPKGHIARGFQTYTLGRSRRTGKATEQCRTGQIHAALCVSGYGACRYGCPSGQSGCAQAYLHARLPDRVGLYLHAR